MALPIMLAASACSSYRHVEPLPGASMVVRVSFPVPRDIRARTVAGDSILLAEVREIQGTVISAQRDTIHIRIGSMRGPWGNFSGLPEGTVAAVSRDASVRVEAKSFDGRRTATMTGGAVGIVVIGVALLSALAVIAALKSIGG
jgi:hypothetical protein